MHPSADLDQLLHKLVSAITESVPRCGPVTVVAIDGGAAAGKSTLARALAARLPAAAVLSTDDLLDGWDGQYDYGNQLRRDVLEPLAAGEEARYRRYDWITGEWGQPITLPVPNTLIVEGFYSIAACGEYASLNVFLDLDRAVREQRWVQREGPITAPGRRWLDRETEYLRDLPTSAAAGPAIFMSIVGPEPRWT